MTVPLYDSGGTADISAQRRLLGKYKLDTRTLPRLCRRGSSVLLLNIIHCCQIIPCLHSYVTVPSRSRTPFKNVFIVLLKPWLTFGAHSPVVKQSQLLVKPIPLLLFAACIHVYDSCNRCHRIGDVEIARMPTLATLRRLLRRLWPLLRQLLLVASLSLPPAAAFALRKLLGARRYCATYARLLHSSSEHAPRHHQTAATEPHS